MGDEQRGEDKEKDTEQTWWWGGGRGEENQKGKDGKQTKKRSDKKIIKQISKIGVAVKLHFTPKEKERSFTSYLLSSSCFDLERGQRERHKKAVNPLDNK